MNVGVAFSNGADSGLLCEALLRLGCNISLYHMLFENPSKAHVEEYQLATNRAKRLGLPLYTVRVVQRACNSKGIDVNDGHKDMFQLETS